MFAHGSDENKTFVFRRNFTGEFLYQKFTGQFLECIYGPVLNWAPFQPPARRGAPASEI